jgi:muconate cycloisomerase
MTGSDKIRQMRVHVVRVPTKAVHSHGSGDVSAINSVILELTTEGGITGWGEASPWPVFTGTVEANAAALHIHLRDYLIGADPLQVERHLAYANRTVVDCGEAKAALETALLDIAGKMSGLSVSELIGGRCRSSIPLSFSVANPNFDADLETVAELHADGVRIFKMKTGFAEHSFDVMRLEKLRAIYGHGIDIRIDYNQGMQAHEALPRLRDLERFRPTFFEQPVPKNNLEAMAEIARALDTPLLADESVFSPRDALIATQMRLADLFSLKIMKSGGIRRALEIAAIARAAGIGVYGGCMFETGIAHLAGTHLMAAIPDLTLGCEFYMATYYLKEDILAEPFPVRDGSVHVPTGPGLGIDVDVEKLAKYRTELLA